MRICWAVTAVMIALSRSAGAQPYPRAELVASPHPTGDGSQLVVILPAAGAAPIVPLGGKFSRMQPAVSPDKTRIAFDESPPRPPSGVVRNAAEARKLVITDWSGRILLRTADVLTKREGSFCAEYVHIGWIDNDRIGVECDDGVNFTIYGVFRVSTGRAEATYIGLDYVWSPDLRRIARRLPQPHFPPNADRSDAVMIDDVTLSAAGDDDTHHDIGKIAWSPDSRRIAFIDTASTNWQPAPIPPGGRDENEGGFLDTNSFLVIAAPDGLTKATPAAGCGDPRWTDATHLRLACGGAYRTLAITDNAFRPYGTGEIVKAPPAKPP